MATFERKVSEIFHNETNLADHFPRLIQEIFNESASNFFRRMKKYSENDVPPDLMLLYDIAFMDYFYEEIDNWLLPWVIDNFAEQFTSQELAEMASQADSHLDFYQVQEVNPGKGSMLKSLVNEHEFFLKDISSSQKLSKWDIILTRCYPWKNSYYATGTLKVLQPQERSFLLERLNREYEAYRKTFKDDDYAHFAKDRWDRLLAIEREITQKNSNRKIYTEFGEFEAKDVLFNVHNLIEALSSISTLAEFEFIEQVEKRDRKNKKRYMPQFHFDWLTLGHEEKLNPLRITTSDGFISSLYQVDIDGNKLNHKVLGNFAIDPQLARLTVYSAELANYAKERLPHVLNEHISFKRITKAQPQEKAAQTQFPDQPLDEETKAKIQEQFFKDYYKDLLDTPIPALNNLTPRQARYDAEAMPLLIEWLKLFENHANKQRQEGNIYLDVNEIKKGLDVEF